jgi:putative SOS response-associated peptidase YedK
MCGRYTLSRGDRGSIVDRFAVRFPESIEPSILHRFNICPGERILAVDHERRALALEWGIGRRDTRSRPCINARAESAGARPLFAPLIAGAEGRCLIPADGWYEWLRSDRRRVRPTPFRHMVDDGGLFAFAGLRTRDAVVVLTTEPNDVCARVHDRMPCVLAGRAQEAAWLDASLAPSEAAALLGPLPGGRVRVTPASPELNRAGREGPDVLEPEATLF